MVNTQIIGADEVADMIFKDTILAAYTHPEAEGDQTVSDGLTLLMEEGGKAMLNDVIQDLVLSSRFIRLGRSFDFSGNQVMPLLADQMEAFLQLPKMDKEARVLELLGPPSAGPEVR